LTFKSDKFAIRPSRKGEKSPFLGGFFKKVVKIFGGIKLIFYLCTEIVNNDACDMQENTLTSKTKTQ